MRHQKAFQSTISDSQGQVSSKIIGWFILLLRMVIVPNSNENKHFPCTFYDSKNQFLQFCAYEEQDPVFTTLEHH